MDLKKREFTKEFKLKVIRAIKAGMTQAQAARQFRLSVSKISKWRKLHHQYQDRAFAYQQVTAELRRRRFVGNHKRLKSDR